MVHRCKLLPTYEVRILTPDGTVAARVAVVPADLREAVELGLPSERMLAALAQRADGVPHAAKIWEARSAISVVRARTMPSTIHPGRRMASAPTEISTSPPQSPL